MKDIIKETVEKPWSNQEELIIWLKQALTKKIQEHIDKHMNEGYNYRIRDSLFKELALSEDSNA